MGFSYIRSWERPGDLPRVIEILCLLASGAQRNEREDTTISIKTILSIDLLCGKGMGRKFEI
jgi:hypothetical protein